MEEVTIVKGNPASLMCLANGTPAPKILWRKDDQPLNLDFHVILENQGMSLHIAKSEADDTGRYTCVASNEAGEVSKHFTLKVLGKEFKFCDAILSRPWTTGQSQQSHK